MKNLLHVLGWLEAGAHALDLAIRLYVAQVFFRSGLLKIGNWDGTLYLFENEYRVPLLPPEAAAWLGTIAELFFPVFLALGLAGRFAAAALFVFNIMAVVSFWHKNGVDIKSMNIRLEAQFDRRGLTLQEEIERPVGEKPWLVPPRSSGSFSS